MSPADNEAEFNEELIPERVAELAGELTEAEDESRRRRLTRQITSLAGRTGLATTRSLRAGRMATRRGAEAGGSATVRAMRASSMWLTARTLEMAPKVPIRGYAALRQQFPGLEADQLADRLIADAARASFGIGATVGAVAAVPFIPTAPLELGVETLALVAIELKLIAELHEAYQMPARGSPRQRMFAYTGAWAERRGVGATSNGLALAVGSPLRRQLERRLLAKASQSAFALAPLLTGAVAGALIDHHETRKLGTLVRDDLRKRGQSSARERELS